MPLFLEQADYDRLLKPELLQQLTGGDTTLRDAAEHTALAAVRAQLHPLFDTDHLLSRTGTDRHPMLVDCVGHMALYALFARVNPAAVPGLRQQRYEAALAWLAQVVAGTLQPGFPPRLDARQQPLLDVRSGGLPRQDLSGF
jgi:phage gp36-like protein